MTPDYLADLWRNAGINPGDTVLLHANTKPWIRRLLKSGCRNPLDVLFRSFLLSVGSEGTVIFPTFNFDVISSCEFNLLTTPSQMGALSEFARLKAYPLRSSHPVYSFCAFGKNAELINCSSNRSAFAEDSPFGLLRALDGKIAILDLEDQYSMTFFHYVEQACRATYRYHKYFVCRYISPVFEDSSYEFSIYVRDTSQHVVTDVNPAGRELWLRNIYRGYLPSDPPGLRTARAIDVFNFTQELIVSNTAEGYLFSRNVN